MKEISFEESKKILTSTLKSIDNCCRVNNISYSLCWGTMIGAIRHHGFIPWDDDMDLMMPREDYNRFLEVYNDPEYGVYAPMKTKNCIQLLIKVFNNKTMIFFDNHPKSLYGLWISIFPYDHVPDENLKSWEMRRTFWMNLYHFKVVRFLTTDSILRKCIKAVLKIPVLPFSSFYLAKKAESCLSEYNNQPTKKVCLWDCGVGFTKYYYFPRELFDDFLDVEFDGVKCKIIRGYDEFMRMYYGDYMTPPPVEKQVPSHNYKAYYKE